MPAPLEAAFSSAEIEFTTSAGWRGSRRSRPAVQCQFTSAR